jgi:hypothetical protein
MLPTVPSAPGFSFLSVIAHKKDYQKKSVIGNLCKKSSYLKTYGYIFADKVFLRLLN